jgi:hypothetical protein
MIDSTTKNFSRMKNLGRLSMLLLIVACFTVLVSCGDDDEKKKQPKNQIKVDGKTFDFTRGYIVSEQIKDGDIVVGSAHWVYLTGGDLEMEDDLVMTGEGPFLAMYIGSDDNNDLIPGEYDMEYYELDFGNVIFFDLYEKFSLGVEDETVVEIFDAWYSGDTEGEVTVSKADDKHVFEINLDEYYFLGDSDDNETEDLVTEDLIGYFSGELEELTVEEEAPVRKASDRRASRIHKSVKFN